jgi:hypothetical protein
LGLRKLLESIGKNVLCYFSIADFDPLGSVGWGAPSYSLYEIQAAERESPQNLNERQVSTSGHEA